MTLATKRQKYQARNVTAEPLPTLAVCELSATGTAGQDVAFFVREADRQASLKMKNTRKCRCCMTLPEFADDGEPPTDAAQGKYA